MIGYLKKRIKKFWATVTLISVELIITLVAFFSALFIFLALIKMIFLEKRSGFDDRAFLFMRRLVSNVNTDIMEVFSFLGTHYFLIPANIVLICYFLFIRKQRWYSIRVPVIALSSMCMMFLLKLIFQRPRPLMPLMEEARGLSFPSGHATMSSTFYGLLIYMIFKNKRLSKPVKTVLICSLGALIIFIGASRVYLRVHYASDVLAGFCFGFMWLILSIWILKRIEEFSRKKIVVVPDNVEADTDVKV